MSPPRVQKQNRVQRTSTPQPAVQKQSTKTKKNKAKPAPKRAAHPERSTLRTIGREKSMRAPKAAGPDRIENKEKVRRLEQSIVGPGDRSIAELRKERSRTTHLTQKQDLDRKIADLSVKHGSKDLVPARREMLRGQLDDQLAQHQTQHRETMREVTARRAELTAENAAASKVLEAAGDKKGDELKAVLQESYGTFHRTLREENVLLAREHGLIDESHPKENFERMLPGQAHPLVEEKKQRVERANAALQKAGIDVELPGSAPTSLIRTAYEAVHYESDIAAAQKRLNAADPTYRRAQLEGDALDGHNPFGPTPDLEGFASTLEGEDGFWKNTFKNKMANEVLQIPELRDRLDQLDQAPTKRVLHSARHSGEPAQPIDWNKTLEGSQTYRGGPPSAAELTKLYADPKSGVTPVTVAERFLDSYARDQRGANPINAFVDGTVNRDSIMAQARASAQRYADGKPLGPLDGVLVGVKDQIDVQGLPTTAGSKFLSTPAARDSEVVSRLRDQGAIIAGKTTMDAFGADVTGMNPNNGFTLNPFNKGRVSGGSSSGSAAAAAAYGVLSLGSDAGGSVVVPAAYNGLYGLKPTQGRASNRGVYPLAPSLSQVGFMANDPATLAAAYQTTAGGDPRDRTLTPGAPPADVNAFNDKRLTVTGADGQTRPLRIGVYQPWFNDADPAMRAAAQDVLKRARAAGAEIVSLDAMPGADLSQQAQMIQYGMELGASQGVRPGQKGTLQDVLGVQPKSRYGPGMRTNMVLVKEGLERADADRVARLRTKMIDGTDRIFAQQADLIFNPTTGIPAPPTNPNAKVQGDSDITRVSDVARFSTFANMTGLPELTVPAGHDKNGVPMGALFIAPPWREDLLLRVGNALHDSTPQRRPSTYYNLVE